MKILKTSLKMLGRGRPSPLTSIANLAYMWKSQDRDKDAMELLKRVEKLKNRYSALITISSLALHKPKTPLE
jgi:hypothetical protein